MNTCERCLAAYDHETLCLCESAGYDPVWHLLDGATRAARRGDHDRARAYAAGARALGALLPRELLDLFAQIQNAAKESAHG